MLIALNTVGQSLWDEYTRPDRLTHAGAGYVITGMTTAIAYNFTPEDWEAEMIGLSIGIAAAAAKEIWDNSHAQHGDIYDFSAAVFGSVAATVTIRIIPANGRSLKTKLKFKFF